MILEVRLAILPVHAILVVVAAEISMTGDQLIFSLWCLAGFMLLPIVVCWSLFGIAWVKGWIDPEITPLEIIERLSKK